MGLTKEQVLERDKSLEKLQITTYKDKIGYVFISYKSENWKKVFEGKVFDLQRRGLRIYSDKNFDDTNHSWLDDMEKNMKRASAVILFISKEYLQSYATLMELFTAIKYGKQIIPVYLEEKRTLFETLTRDVDLEDAIVKMEPAEAEVLNILLNCTTTGRYAEKMRLIRQECESKIHKQNFAIMNIVEAFQKILDDAEMKDNLFDKSINSLINTIKDAASRDEVHPEVFENRNLLLEDVTPVAPQTVKTQEQGTSQKAEQQEEIDNEKEEIVDKEETEEDVEQEPGKKKAFSVTGDISYTLYGQKYTENQSDMMLRFFAQVLKRHPEYIADLAEYKGMNCISKVDYTKRENVTPSMPSYFRNCQFFEFENGESICVGTAYGVNDKLKKMAALLQIVGEDDTIFSSEQVELPKAKAAAVGTSGTGQGNSSSVSYRIFGKAYTTNQTDMIGNVFSAFIEKHPDLLEEIAENLTCVAVEDYSATAKEDRPVYFASCNVYEVNGKKYTVGGAYAMKEKVKLIEKLIAFCDEPNSSVSIDGVELKEATKNTRSKVKKNFL